MTNRNLILHVTSADPRRIELALTLASNYRIEALLRKTNLSPQEIAINAAIGNLQPYGDINVVIVLNGPAVRNIVDGSGNDELKKKAESAVEFGIEIHVGEYSLREQGCDAGKVWPFLQVMPVTVDIVELQDRGYAYIKV